MLAEKTHIGQRLDLQHYKDVLMNRTILVLDGEDQPYDLGDNEVLFEFFAKPHGTSLEQFSLGEAIDNAVTFFGQSLDYRPGIYYHECYQMTTDSPEGKVLLFYGVSEII